MPPPCQPFGLPFDPPGHPCGVPPASPAPPPAPVRQWKGVGKRSAQGRQPRRGVGKKSKWWRRSRPPGRQRWKCGEGRAAGGQGWGQPVGSPRAVHGLSLLLSTGREAPAGRAAISTSPPPGAQLGPLWGPVLPRRAHDFRSGSLVSTLACQVHLLVKWPAGGAVLTKTAGILAITAK